LEKADLENKGKQLDTKFSKFNTTEFKDINSMWSSVKQLITESINKHVPTKSFQRNIFLLVGLGLYAFVDMSTIKMSWSLFPIGGRVLHLSTCPGWLVNRYRPPNKQDIKYVESTFTEIQNLKSKSKNHIFLLGGDFNLPDITSNDDIWLSCFQ
jgi:hypothetical protein